MQIFPHGTKSILIRPRCTECDGFFSYIYMNQLKWISIKIPYMEHLGGKSSIYTHLEISENKISIGSTPQPLLTVTTGLLGFGNPLPRLHPGGATDPKKKQFPHLEATFLDGIDFETNARLLGRYAPRHSQRAWRPFPWSQNDFQRVTNSKPHDSTQKNQIWSNLVLRGNT